MFRVSQRTSNNIIACNRSIALPEWVYRLDKSLAFDFVWIYSESGGDWSEAWNFQRLFYWCVFSRLENWRFEEWGDQVTVVSCDMREWAAPEKADIIVSELLGSFGDNELSPECLDGAQHFLKGISGF